MAAESGRPRWSVLMLVTGHGNEALRGVVERCLLDLGFDFRVYDAESYTADPTVHSHEACIEAVSANDIVVAFLDTSEGSSLQVDQISSRMREKLIALGVLPPIDSTRVVPTITHAEILIARALKKPTLLFVTEDVSSRIDQTLESITGGSELRSIAADAPDSKSLIEQKKWDVLFQHYHIPVGRVASERHLLFIERLRREAPNWVTYFDPRQTDELCRKIKDRLAGVAGALIRRNADQGVQLLERQRGPLVSSSVRDLLRKNLILEPPYQLESGALSGPLVDVRGENPKGVASSLLEGRNVLLLGDPGHGKSTAALLCFRELVAASKSGVDGIAPLFVSLRGLSASDEGGSGNGSADWLLRLTLSAPFGRALWPQALKLPQRRWALVLDGADESALSGSMLASLLGSLPDNTSVLLTCREADFDRMFRTSKSSFHIILRLLPWNESQVQQYATALRDSGSRRAAELVERQRANLALAGFISIPLWLSMLAYLAERDASRTRPPVHRVPGGQYELLRICAAAVAGDEAGRRGMDPNNGEQLQRIWRKIAWQLLQSRRESRMLHLNRMRETTGLEAGTSLDTAALSVLEFFGDIVDGFFHEVFFDYWLAEHVAHKLMDSDSDAREIASILSLHRSYVTNKLLRQCISSRGQATQVATKLRQAYLEAAELGPRGVFARNQIVYLVARVDVTEATRSFVRSVWHSQEAEFVRYSAAFSSVILGDTTVEHEYYQKLEADPIADRQNRGYHLLYYGDVEPDTVPEVVPSDDGSSEAKRTLVALFQRLTRTEPRHRSLRRVELFTIRRFLETGRSVPTEIPDPVGALERMRTDAVPPESAPEFRSSIESEVQRVLELVQGDQADNY